MFRVSTRSQISCRFYGYNSLAERNLRGRFLSSRPPSPKTLTHKRILPIAGGLFFGTTLLYLFIPDVSRSAPTYSSKTLSLKHFSPATVISNEVSGPNTKVLKLRVSPHLIPKDGKDLIDFGPIWSVYIKDDDIQVERPYTPLESLDGEGNMMFWIKRYPKGEVGRWLHSKQPGDTIELRGPFKTWAWKDEEWEQVILISGGTGITPFYQLVRQIFEHPTNSSPKTRITLIHGSRTPEELPPEQILGPLIAYAEKHPENFNLKLFVDSMDGSIPSVEVPSLEEGRINDEALKRIMDIPKSSRWQSWFGRKDKQPASAVSPRTLFLVCGPEPMIASVAGPYGRNYSQGPTLGVLGRLGATPRQVRKI